MKISSFYQTTYLPSKKNELLVIDLGGGFKKILPEASILKITEKKQASFLWNVGSTCKMVTQFINNNHYKKIIVYGSGYSAYAVIVWAMILNDFLQKFNKSCSFVSINPEKEFPTFESYINEAIKPYIHIHKFLATRKTAPQGIIYLAENNDFESELSNKNIKNFTIFQTNFSQEDINYFIKRSVPMSLMGSNSVYKQFKAKGKPCTLDTASEFYNNNFPSIHTVFRTFASYDNIDFISKDSFELNTVQQIVQVVSNLSQFFNSVSFHQENFLEKNMTIVFQFTYLNIHALKHVYTAYLKLSNRELIKLVFLEIPLSNRIGFIDFTYFEHKYNYLWNKLQPALVIIPCITINRAAILGYTAKKNCPVYTIEEGLGTYVNYNKAIKDKNNKVNNLSVIDNYTEKALIANFGSKTTKKSVTGFLDFDEVHVTFTDFFNLNNAHYFNPIDTYINSNLTHVNDINSQIYNLVESKSFALYAEQPLGFPKIEYYSVILETLCNVVTEEKILFCMHPRNTHNIPIIQSIINFMGMQDKIKIWNSKSIYKVEFLAYASNSNSFYSLYSSSLIYLSKSCPHISRYSIGDIIIQRFNFIHTQKTMSELIEGMDILKFVDNEICENNQDFQPIKFIKNVDSYF